MASCAAALLLALLVLPLPPAAAAAAPPAILLSTAQRARAFDGVGGISGGGATSRLIEDYPEPQRTALYDALFAPQSGAAFQVVKVEIPADADTTCGSEVAHRHDAGDGGSCTRGYEGTFLREANARLPGIAAHSLQWAAPSFVAEADVGSGRSLFTRTNIDQYVLPWLRCMRDSYGVELAWQGGGWNEKPFNASYMVLLRQQLSAGGFAGTGIAAADQCCGADWNIVRAMATDANLTAAVGAISTHCAGSMNKQDTPPEAVALGIPCVGEAWAGAGAATRPGTLQPPPTDAHPHTTNTHTPHPPPQAVPGRGAHWPARPGRHSHLGVARCRCHGSRGFPELGAQQHERHHFLARCLCLAVWAELSGQGLCDCHLALGRCALLHTHGPVGGGAHYALYAPAVLLAAQWHGQRPHYRRARAPGQWGVEHFLRNLRHGHWPCHGLYAGGGVLPAGGPVARQPRPHCLCPCHCAAPPPRHGSVSAGRGRCAPGGQRAARVAH
jgi:hypothetical protein